ncbi:MAG TPA: SPOR domain-containing protein [Alphaproteobacteria bacterium]|nr:SPOR domain-containing protein [Alphaproteobacteria bacterium]
MRLSVRGFLYGALSAAAVLATALVVVGALAEEASAPSPYNAPVGDLAQSAAQGDSRAQYELGVAYANGDGVPADYAEAAHWFSEAAHKGNSEARRQLAFMVQMGLAVPADDQSAAVADGVPVRVQVASVASEADGAREWRRLRRLHPEALGSLTMAVEAFDTPTGDRLFRVEGGPLDEAAARTVCDKLRAAGAGCRIVRPATP